MSACAKSRAHKAKPCVARWVHPSASEWWDQRDTLSAECARKAKPCVARWVHPSASERWDQRDTLSAEISQSA
jgi:hypothetical protein